VGSDIRYCGAVGLDSSPFRSPTASVERTTAAVDDAAAAFVTVSDTVQQTDERVQEISEVMTAQAARTEEVHKTVGNIE